MNLKTGFAASQCGRAMPDRSLSPAQAGFGASCANSEASLTALRNGIAGFFENS